MHWSGGGGADGGLTLLLDNCSLKGFGTGKFFWPRLLVGCGWLLLIPQASEIPGRGGW